MKNLLLIIVALFLFTACESEKAEGTVLIFKYKDSVQCNFDSGVPLETMAAELSDANVDVLCSTQTHDGNAVITVCGAETGVINVFKIPSPSLIAAENLGFNDIQILESANVVLECE